ncbi:MAG: SprT-like domain-containing protein [Bacteroidetes bacterium]|nr:SprT-like domain-containing protein [Bacteroidota bacterium]
MPKKEVPLNHLQQYLPNGTVDAVSDYLQHYKVHLTIARQRQSILGDYRHRTLNHTHRISVNGNLNPYAFLITLLHELAHLLTYEQYGNNVNAHGREWKKIFGQLLKQFIEHKVFPEEIVAELKSIVHNPAASSCAEDGLLRVLRKYNTSGDDYCLIEELQQGAKFKIIDGRIFQKGERLRKRYKCQELATGKLYLFSPVYEVALI